MYRPTLTIQRIKRDENTIISNIKYTDKNYSHNYKGCENEKKSIKAGEYQGVFSYSPKFRTYLYYIMHPTRLGLRIHIGNTYKDSTGCILIGDKENDYIIYNSRKALKHFHAVSKEQEIKIIIKNEKNFRKGIRRSPKEILKRINRSVRGMVENRLKR